MKCLMLLTFSLIFLLVACASNPTVKPESEKVYVSSIGEIKSRLYMGPPSEALALYEKQLKYRVNDPKQDFLHELNLGALSLLAKQTKKARQHFVKAAQHIDWQNYTSIINEASEVLLLKSTQERYRLQPQEYLNLQYMQAMSYILENDWENALISVRALHETIRRIRSDLNNQDINNMAFYYWFAGYVYEQNKLFDDARIDYEATYKLKPDWPHLNLHLWRVYAMTGDKEKELEFAKKARLAALPEAKRLQTAKNAEMQYLFINNIGWQNWLNFKLASVHIERRQKDETSIWGSDEVFLGYSRSKLDQEIEQKSPKKLDNPAYLLHVNPYSITYLVFGSIFKAYWEALAPEGDPEFIVNSFEFIPNSVSLIYLNPCFDNGAVCKLKSYSYKVSDYTIQSGPAYLMQFTGEYTQMPFK